MVANLTVGRKGQEEVWPDMVRVAEAAQTAKDAFLRAVDEDTEAFTRVMDAMRMKAASEDERRAKAEAVREANRGATLVPLSVLDRTLPALELAADVAARGNPNSVSDAAVAAMTARTAAEGAYHNVLINLRGIEGDEAWVAEIGDRAARLVAGVRDRAQSIVTEVETRLEKG
jgi:formiminotetrahydrofolate cyclodeaminase